MNPDQPIVVYWFRRDLRLDDNTALFHALNSGLPVLPVFIHDLDILSALEADDRRVRFIRSCLQYLNGKLKPFHTGIREYRGRPEEIFRQILSEFRIAAVYAGEDYEPYARSRDQKIEDLLALHKLPFHTFRDHVIFGKDEVVKSDGEPYTVFTPYSRRWLSKLSGEKERLLAFPSEKKLSAMIKLTVMPLAEPDFSVDFPEFQPYEPDPGVLAEYVRRKDFPASGPTSGAGTHLRFGTVSIRKLVSRALEASPEWLNELIWREFFMQILWHFPKVTDGPFRSKYRNIIWRDDPQEIDAWIQGRTGYPLVDAGMRELCQTGHMHGRVRMVTASFLVKHLLVNWQIGEAWFASQLLDFELASNNGNWQWVAGTGCDSAPYFRIFNPLAQAQKFDPDEEYIRKWIPEYGSATYPKPMVVHEFARSRCLQAYKSAAEGTFNNN
jgi:deoxyribodipyrimidine photo-lyase